MDRTILLQLGEALCRARPHRSARAVTHPHCRRQFAFGFFLKVIVTVQPPAALWRWLMSSVTRTSVCWASQARASFFAACKVEAKNAFNSTRSSKRKAGILLVGAVKR